MLRHQQPSGPQIVAPPEHCSELRCGSKRYSKPTAFLPSAPVSNSVTISFAAPPCFFTTPHNHHNHHHHNHNSLADLLEGGYKTPVLAAAPNAIILDSVAPETPADIAPVAAAAAPASSTTSVTSAPDVIAAAGPAAVSAESAATEMPAVTTVYDPAAAPVDPGRIASSAARPTGTLPKALSKVPFCLDIPCGPSALDKLARLALLNTGPKIMLIGGHRSKAERRLFRRLKAELCKPQRLSL